MSWTNLSLINTNREWQYTEEFEGDYVRLRHFLGVNQADLSFGFTGLIAQAFNFPDGVELFNIRKLFPLEEDESIAIINPFPGRSRRLAVRGQRRYQTEITWQVAIDVWNPEQQIDLTTQINRLESKLDRILIAVGADHPTFIAPTVPQQAFSFYSNELSTRNYLTTLR